MKLAYTIVNGEVLITGYPDMDVQASPCRWEEITDTHVREQVQVWESESVYLSHDVARVVASWYHSPSPLSRAITALSHGAGFMVDRLYFETRTLVSAHREVGDYALPALLDYAAEAVRDLTQYRGHVTTSNGHVFMGEDGPDLESCLTCGGQWHIRPTRERFHVGEYVNSAGRPATPCHPDRVHGIERICEADGGPGCAP